MRFPITVIDQFFSDPYIVLSTLDTTEKDAPGNYPGSRYQVPNHILQYIATSITSYLFRDELIQYKIEASFHVRKENEYGDGYEHGFIHRDTHGPSLAGLIYMTPYPDPDTGTSLFDKVEPLLETYTSISEADRLAYYHRTLDDQDVLSVVEQKNDKERCFYETLNVKNVFNRCVFYDSHSFHRTNKLSSAVDRTSIVFFMSFMFEESPMEHMKRKASDKSLR